MNSFVKKLLPLFLAIVCFCIVDVYKVEAATFVNDTFTDTTGTLLENHTGEQGTPWIKTDGISTSNIKVSSGGRIYNNAGAGNQSVYISTATSTTNEYDVQADFVTVGGSYSGGLAPYVDIGTRVVLSSGNFTGYLGGWDPDNQRWTIFKGLSALAHSAATLTNGQTYTVKLTVRNSGENAILTLYVNGIQQVTYTDPSPITVPGSPAVWFYNAATDTTGIHIDNFSASNPSGDFTAPSVTITSPITGTSTRGTSVTLTATSTDNVGVEGVQFKLDSITNIGGEGSTSPYSVSWNSTGVSDGNHSIVAVARDAAGNYATSTAVNVYVANNAPVISSISSNSPSTTGTTITWTTNNPTDSQVEYGLSSSYTASSTYSSSQVTSHSVLLSGLSSGTVYHYRVVSIDVFGNRTNSTDQTFTTATTATEFVNDTFTDTAGTILSSHTGEVGATWTLHPSYAGGTIVVDNIDRIQSGPNLAVYYASGIPSTADYSVQGDLTLLSTDGTYLGVAGRMATTANTYYLFEYWPAHNSWELYKAIDGSFTLLDSLNESFGPSGTTHTIKLTMEGSTISGYSDGVLKVTASDSSITAAGRAGVVSAGTAVTDSTGERLDNFLAINSGDTEASTTPLTIGTLSASSTPSGITLDLSAAVSGGTGSGYGYSIYRSTSPNFATSSGNLLTTLSTFPYTDTSAASGTVYYYRAFGFDSASSTIQATLNGLGSATGYFATPGTIYSAKPSFNATSSLSNSNIVFIGDSITAGVGVGSPSTQAAPVIAVNQLANQSGKSIEIRNMGISGYTTSDWQPGGSTYNGAVQASNSSSAAKQLYTANPSYQMIFSIMLGTNDSAITGPTYPNRTKAQYKENLRNIIDQILNTDWPTAKIYLNYPIYYTPNLHNSYLFTEDSLSLIQQYQQAIDELVASYASTNPNQVIVGDTYGYGYFTTRFTNEMNGEDGSNGTYYVHPNATGAANLGSFWATAIYNNYPSDIDVMGPAISAITSSASQTSATITWTTDEVATSQVEYGLTSSYTASSTLDSSMVTSHSVTLIGLSANTTYHYRVISKDASDNTATSSDQTFTTSAESSPSSGSSGGGSGGRSSGASSGRNTFAPTFTRNLALQAKGEDVKVLQRFLISKGYLMAGNDTGYFGPLTYQALVQYQRVMGIVPVSGYLGPITRSVIAGAANTLSVTQVAPQTLSTVFTKDLKLGITDSEVKMLQRYLNSKGFTVSTSGAGSAGLETPYFGAATQAALIKFQQRNGIVPATGYFGPKTRAIVDR